DPLTEFSLGEFRGAGGDYSPTVRASETVPLVCSRENSRVTRRTENRGHGRSPSVVQTKFHGRHNRSTVGKFEGLVKSPASPVPAPAAGADLPSRTGAAVAARSLPPRRVSARPGAGTPRRHRR